MEATIHYLDLTLDLPAPPAPASALLHVRKVLDGLLGTELQLEWDDVEYALKGTGRVALTAADRDQLGDLALKIPCGLSHFTAQRRTAPLLLGVSGRQHHNGWGSGTAFGCLGQ